MKKLIAIFSLICACVCMMSCSSSSTPSSVAEQQFKIMQSGDYGQLADLFYFEDGHEEEGRQMMSGLGEKLDKELEKQGGIDSYEVVSEEISDDGETARVEVAVTYGNGEVDNQSVKTVMHDGKWYLYFGK